MKMKKSDEYLELFILIIIMSCGQTKGELKIERNLIAVTSPAGLENFYVQIKKESKFV